MALETIRDEGPGSGASGCSGTTRELARLIDEPKTKDQGPDYGARPISYYAGAIRPELPGHPFAAAPSRAGWLALHLAVAAAGIFSITRGWGGPAAALVLALVVGHSFAAMAFVAHEALHGSIVRGSAARYAIGWIGFLPLLVSPTHWVAWHNKAHHGNTMRPGVDPDVFPTLEEYQASRLVRLGHRLTPGSGRLTGLFGLPIGFTTQSFSVLFLMARQRGYLSPRSFTQAIAETLADVALWGALAFALGPRAFLFAFVIPFAVANVIVMSYILTNHSLSPLTEINDPLLNALTVTVPRPLEIMHLGFGMHVEHHIFPAMSPRYARDVRRVLLDKFPGRYQSMPFGRAMLQVFRTGRVYKNATTLMDPLTGQEWPTLAPPLSGPSGERPLVAA